MDSITLSPKELIVLSSMIGAKNFYGIQNPFRGMTKNEIQAEIPDIQLQLEKRGLVSLGFDDSFTMTPLCEAFLPVCALCERYLTIESIASGKIQPSIRIYFRGGEIVLLLYSDEGCELRKMTCDEAVKYLLTSTYSHCTDVTEDCSIFSISQSDLGKIRNISPKDALNFLIKADCPASVAEALILGLHQKCEYCSLIAVDLSNNLLNILMCIITAEGCLRLTPTEMHGSKEDIWEISWINRDSIYTEIQSIINHYCEI